jgi:hypothetical protein
MTAFMALCSLLALVHIGYLLVPPSASSCCLERARAIAPRVVLADRREVRATFSRTDWGSPQWYRRVDLGMSASDAVDGSSIGTRVPRKWALLRLPRFRGATHADDHDNRSRLGLDIAKSVFQVHGVDAAGEVVIRRQLKRRSVLAFFQKLPPGLVGIEACASSHFGRANSRHSAIPFD